MDSDGTAEIRRLLTDTHTWAVVGLSANTFRPAYGVARFLQSVGKRIVPVHPRAETVHGETGYATLADIPFEVDVVDVFVNSRRAGEIADQALLEAAAARVRAADRTMVMDRCPAIEWPRLGL
jgi:uncharacterized protein